MRASDVKFAVEGVGNLPARLHSHPEWGWRAIVVVNFNDQEIWNAVRTSSPLLVGPPGLRRGVSRVVVVPRTES